MDLKFSETHSDFFKKHYKEILDYFYEDIPSKEICKRLNRDYKGNIKYQAINGFRRMNKTIIDEWIENKKKDDTKDYKEKIALDYCKDKLKEAIKFLSQTLKEDIKTLEPKERIKYFISAVNAMSKLEGLDKTEVNINNYEDEDLLELIREVDEDLADLYEPDSENPQN